MSSKSPRFDLVSLGEAMLRLSVPSGARIDDTRSFDVEIGGAESNVCVALARLGRQCGWVGRLPANALGNAVLRALRADGVDVTAAQQVADERLGTYFIEYAAPPRASQVIYDRADSAAARMTVDDLNWDYLLNTRILHITGITAALSRNCYAVVAEAIRRARAAGITISFDVNYRGKLWDAPTAGAQLRPLIAEADVLFCKSNDATLLFGCSGGAEGILGGLRDLTRATAIYTTFGADGAALLHDGTITERPALPVQIIDRVGSGDAFAAGVLDGILDDDPVRGIERGVALAAIALTQFGDRVLSSRAELEAVMRQGSTDIAR